MKIKFEIRDDDTDGKKFEILWFDNMQEETNPKYVEQVIANDECEVDNIISNRYDGKERPGREYIIV